MWLSWGGKRSVVPALIIVCLLLYLSTELGTDLCFGLREYRL